MLDKNMAIKRKSTPEFERKKDKFLGSKISTRKRKSWTRKCTNSETVAAQSYFRPRLRS